MPNWLVALIVGGSCFLLFLAVLSGVIIKCSYAITRAKAKEKYWYDRANELQHIIDGYGMRTMTIGKEKDL